MGTLASFELVGYHAIINDNDLLLTTVHHNVLLSVDLRIRQGMQNLANTSSSRGRFP